MFAMGMSIWTQLALAGPRLDYVALEECPDAGRFSDEVSAKIGAQAFTGSDGAMIVRIARSGEEVLGTMELGEGVRMVRGTSCGEVFDGLVLATATSLGIPTGAPALVPASAPAQAPSVPDRVPVTMDSTKPGVTVARITGRGAAVAGNTTAVAVYYEDLCIAPCTFEIAPGFHEIGTYGEGTRGITNKFQIDGPIHIESRPSPASTLWGGLLLSTAGATLAVTGAVFFAIPGCEDYKAWSGRGEVPIDRQCLSNRRSAAGAAIAGGALGLGLSVPLYFKTGSIERVE